MEKILPIAAEAGIYAISRTGGDEPRRYTCGAVWMRPDTARHDTCGETRLYLTGGDKPRHYTCGAEWMRPVGGEGPRHYIFVAAWMQPVCRDKSSDQRLR